MILASVEKLLSDFRPEHSEFQMENFIIGGGHPWGQYKQALRELSARHHAMVESGEQIKKLKDEIARERRRWFNGRSVIEIEKRLDNAKRERKSKAREYLTFYRIARDLKRQLGEISPQRRRELEADMWLDKARRMAASMPRARSPTARPRSTCASTRSTSAWSSPICASTCTRGPAQG